MSELTLIPKSDKDLTRENYTNISHEYGCKNPQQNSSKLNSTMF